MAGYGSASRDEQPRSAESTRERHSHSAPNAAHVSPSKTSLPTASSRRRRRDGDGRGGRGHARGRALRGRAGAARSARGRHDHALLARRALRGARARRAPRRALRPARFGRVDHRRSQSSGVHAARSRSRRRGARPRTRRPAGAPGGHRRGWDGRPARRARPPERVLGAHPRRNASRRSRPGRRRPA